jgi:hypothetical protein
MQGDDLSYGAHRLEKQRSLGVAHSHAHDEALVGQTLHDVAADEA